MYYVYLIECEDKTIYTGITTDIQRRFKEHNSGKGGAYTRSKKVKNILHAEQFETRSQAQKREAEIKCWRREKRLALLKEFEKQNLLKFNTKYEFRTISNLENTKRERV